MLGKPHGSSLALCLCLACGPTPDEVVEVYDGKGSSTSATATTSGESGAEAGPVADGSGSATTSTSDDGGSTTLGVDPSSTSTGEVTTASTGSTSLGESSSSDDGSLAQSCQELYDGAPGYVLCGETDTDCTFNATMGGNDCHQMCGLFGGTCIDALDNPNSAGQECFVQGDSTCENNTKSTTICICSK